MRRLVVTAFASALLAAPAFAQDRPAIFPTRDVAVQYRMTGGPQPGTEMTMSWRTNGQLMRVDMPGGLGYMVADQANNRGFMVMEAQRMIMDIPAPQAAAHQEILRNARFTREGSGTVAGTACTNWQYQSGQQTGKACITSDGVMLRSETMVNGQPVTLEAVRVEYGAQDASRYARPQGYQQMQMPQMPPGQGAPRRPGG